MTDEPTPDTRTHIYVYRTRVDDPLEWVGSLINGRRYQAYTGTPARPPVFNAKAGLFIPTKSSIPVAFGITARQALRRGIAWAHHTYYPPAPVLVAPVPPPEG